MSDYVFVVFAVVAAAGVAVGAMARQRRGCARAIWFFGVLLLALYVAAHWGLL